MISVVGAKSRVDPQKNFLLGRKSRSVPTANPMSYNVSELFKIFKMKDRVNVEQFYQMCPSIVDEVLTIHSKTRSGTKSEEIKCNSTTTLSNTEIYGYGTLAVSIISIMSVLGAVVMKAATGAVRQYVMAALLALATGNLCGDALLHLLPEVLSDEGEDDDGDGLTTSEIILTGSTDISIASSRMCAVLASIYAFFILELIMSLYHTHDHDHTPDRSGDDLSNINVSVLKVITDEQYDSNNTASCSTSQDGGEHVCKEERDNIVNRHRAPASLAWMVIVGDAIHNFADGLAIGAAFTGQLSSGLSTSIAVICHELPHELGDFAVLVSTGMSIKKALILNFVSSLTAFAGLYVGIAAGKLEAATEWIFLVGAGMFLYVALANLLPELQKYFQEHRTWQMFLAQNIGILSGYAAMLTIAIFEDDMGF
ncbi:zinc transporter ZIP4 isoform X2 [Patella vulgata]|nr:zinc transporter ZIP4 isoform X2 [Patella vulgata]